TIFTCDCGDTYKGDYTDKIAHSYIADVTEPTCTASGYTVYTCENCGKTYTADYKDMLGHKPSDWIIDEPATIEHAGEKHTECLTCGEVLSRVAIPQLVEKDRTDEDGNSKVGDFSILVTNSNGTPIFDSEISIDINDNVTVKLPKDRLLDYEDQTIITAINTDAQTPKAELQIFVYDENNNAAIGKTDENGQLKVPNNKTSTGDNSGTVGKDDDDKKNTFVVKVTDKMNVVIPNCDVYIGESNNIVVDLPDGIKPTSEYPVIITVTDQHGEPKQGITVITLGDADYIEKGVTDMFGKITLPTAKDGFTDDTGKVRIDGMYVFVNDENGAISNAFVKLNDDDTVSVTLPDGTNIDYSNRITVTVTDKDGNPLKDISVTVSDETEKSLTDKTDENGKMVVPPLSEDMTDSEGKAKANGYNVLITDETKPIENAFITIGEGQINVMLPEGSLIDINNRITATITDSEDKPVKDMTVIFTDKSDRTESNVTDENGRATVPHTNIDVTDFNGYGEVSGYIVIVKNADGAIEKAYVKHNAEIKNEDGTVKEKENISVELPENIKFDYANRIVITVSKKADNTAVKDMTVNVSEKAVEGIETKSLTGTTDKDGIVILPPTSEGVTDKDGKTDISETTPGEDTDGDGKTDTEETKAEYNITVEDTKGKIENAFIEIKDGKITVTLPETHTLTTSNQTTVTVLDNENKGVANVSVTVTDKNKATATKSTDTNGKITVPVKSSGGGSSSGGGGSRGNGGGGYISTNVTNITVTDKNGKNVSVSKSTDRDGKITLTLPNGTDLTGDNYYTIKATDNKGNAKADVAIILKDKKNNSTNGTTDKNGMLILPASEHKAYIFGYADGTFRPDNNMSRAEAAAIFARLISEQKNEKISGKATFKDISSKDWFAIEVGYLEKYGIIKGYSDNTFKPNESVTRAEFVAMTVRFNSLFNDVKKGSYTVKYTDVATNYWAYSDVAYAKHAGWLNG
ncbi:MAG: S-layer homology domain-containing protein, partial [Clostridia bacterium]|nr:S-layer homology domain-containing protein [Clostridia bacterium]